jgi:hypothetical protein
MKVKRNRMDKKAFDFTRKSFDITTIYLRQKSNFLVMEGREVDFES